MSDQPQREMTLDEWVDKLPAGHRARAELSTLRQETERLKGELADLQDELAKSRKNTSDFSAANHRQIGVIQAQRAALQRTQPLMQVWLDREEWDVAHDRVRGMNLVNDIKEAMRINALYLTDHSTAQEKERQAEVNRLKASNEALVGACHVFIEARKHNDYGMQDAEDAIRAAIRQSALATTAGTAVAPTEKETLSGTQNKPGTTEQ